MNIKEINIKNFKSYGNNTQTLTLTDNGGLILLNGKNGYGKTSLLNSFDYVLYGKVKPSSNKKKYLALSTLPNRINTSDMLVSIKFETNGTEVSIKRGISPNVLTLEENGVEDKRAGKTNIDDKIEKYVGVDIDTFKSFVSVNINDFKNFITLSNEDKQLLLDKLFNLEIINNLNNILKDINKSNKSLMSKHDTEINTLQESINSIKISIQKSLEKQLENFQDEIASIQAGINSKKDDYLALKEKLEKIKKKDTELKAEYEKEREQLINIQNEIRNAQKDIDLYNMGKCPTCKTSFGDEFYQSLKSSLLEKKTSLENIKLEIETNIEGVKKNQIKLQGISDTTNTAFSDITFYIKNSKSQIEKLQEKANNQNKNSDSVVEFENTIKQMSDKKDVAYESVTICKEKETYYKELTKIFSEDGVKKSIIAGIVKPINVYIEENIKHAGLPFQIVLDNTFNASIKQFGTEIEPETLSTGESRICNMIILISYLRLIKNRTQINVLFFDELFASIDFDNVEKILYLLKVFANECKINLFVVHHAIVNREYFDRIIQIKKNVFSEIIEISD